MTPSIDPLVFEMLQTLGAERPGAPDTPEGTFDAMLAGVEKVDAQQQSAHDTLAALASGEEVAPHRVFMELEKADISLKAMVAVRNRAIAAYEQILNMAI